MGQRVGYRRVSSADQNLARQLEGVELDKVFEDKISGKDTKVALNYECVKEYNRRHGHDPEWKK